jgi:hypothetical protein
MPIIMSEASLTNVVVRTFIRGRLKLTVIPDTCNTFLIATDTYYPKYFND